MYFVYVLTNNVNKVLYVGVTNDLCRRVREHKTKAYSGFTARYRVEKLVYYEVFDSIFDAIAREKQLKGGSRERKMELVTAGNPHWVELDAEQEVAKLG